MTFTEIVTAVCDRLNLTSDDAVARVGRSVNERHRRATASIGLQVSRNAEVFQTATLGSQYITFEGIERLNAVIDKSTGRNRIIPEVTVGELDGAGGTTTDKPTLIAVYRVDAGSVTVKTNSIPQEEYTLYATGYEQATTLATTQEPKLPESFHDIIIHGVIADELRKQEKLTLALENEAMYEKRLAELRLFVASSAYKDIYQAKHELVNTGIFGSDADDSDVLDGAMSWTQTGLITFDRDPSAPFAVSANSAKVANLDADLLDGDDWDSDLTFTGDNVFQGTSEFDGVVNFDAAVDMDSTLDVAGLLTARANVLATGTRPEFQVLGAGGHTTKGRFFQPSTTNASLSLNLSYDGTNWNLDDTTLEGAVLHCTVTATNSTFNFYSAAASSNPATLSRIGYFDEDSGLVMEGGNILVTKTRPEVKVLATGGTGYGRFHQATANGAAYITFNLSHDGSNWVRDSTSLGCTLMQCYADATQEIWSVYTAPDAANPANITEKLKFIATATDGSQKLIVGDTASTGVTYFVANGPAGAISKGFQIFEGATVMHHSIVFNGDHYFDFGGTCYFRDIDGGAYTVRISLPGDSAGITFPASQAASTNANTLDDYEEGTWTPTLTPGTSGSVVVTNNGSSYVKIGKAVYWQVYLSMDVTAPVGVMDMSLPFTVAGDTGAAVASCLSFNAACTPWLHYPGGTASVRFYHYTGTDVSATFADKCQDTTTIRASGWYTV